MNASVTQSDQTNSETFTPLADIEVDIKSEDTSKTPITGNAKSHGDSTEDDNHSSIHNSDASESLTNASSNNEGDSYTLSLSEQAKKALDLAFVLPHWKTTLSYLPATEK